LRPKRVLPPVEYWGGTKPSHAANCRPLVNSCPVAILAVIAEAVSGPTPATRRFMLLRQDNQLPFVTADPLISKRDARADRQSPRGRVPAALRPRPRLHAAPGRRAGVRRCQTRPASRGCD